MFRSLEEEVNGTSGDYGPGGDYESMAARSVAIALPLALLTCLCVLIAGWWNSPNRMAINQHLLHTTANDEAPSPEPTDIGRLELSTSVDGSLPSDQKTVTSHRVSIVKGPTCRVGHGAEFPQELTVDLPDSNRPSAALGTSASSSSQMVLNSPQI